jgi:hypothetical protein
MSEVSFVAFAHVHPKPRIESVLSSDRQITIRVSQPLSTQIIDGGVFALDDSLSCTTAVIASDSIVVATSPTTIETGVGHTIRVRSFALRDIWNSPLDTSQMSTWHALAVPSDSAFYIVRWQFEGNARIHVEFNLHPDNNALDISHYVLSPFGKFYRVYRDTANRNALYLDLAPGTTISALGIPFVLCITGITAEGSIPLENTEGNCAGETLTEPNLENVMVYPNPTKETDETLTFARLTAQAEINIYTLDLRFLKRLSTTDKNGGVQWDMRDENGRILPSGVYWFHVTGKDDNGNDVKPKEAKFVLIRNK